VKVRFWGVRGSVATPGPEFLRYGGNTTAVEVRGSGGHRLLIDLGTGVTQLAKELMEGEFGRGEGELPILLSHTHLDHIQGLPFFTPFFIRGNKIRIIGPELADLSLIETLQNHLNPHYSPLYGLENLAAGVRIETIEHGTSIELPGFRVLAAAMPHGGMTSFAFRIEADGASLAFVGDVEHPDDGPLTGAVELARGVDLLIHDAMFTDEAYELRRGWGHSAVSDAIAVAESAGVGSLALFHHNPDATDDDIDAIVAWARARSRVPIFAASEGPAFDVRSAVAAAGND
jgi:phosphoribosyl 1,2-cyclic phosphodiesterase